MAKAAAKAKARGTAAAGDVGKRDRHEKRKAAFLDKAARSSLAAREGVKKQKAKQRKKPGSTLTDFDDVLKSLEEASKNVVKAADDKAKRRKDLEARRGRSVKTLGARKHITVDETRRAQAVVAHAQFQRDPFGAVTAHLASVMPAVPVAKPRQSGNRGQGQRRNKKKSKGAKDSVNKMLDSMAL